MAKKLYPKNFLTIQVPPRLEVTERHDGAQVIYPPMRGNEASTMATADTGSCTESTSDTETHAGTSTNGETWTRIQKTATVLQSGKNGFPIVAAGFESAQPTSYVSEPDLSQDSFQLAKAIPEPTSDEDIRLTGEQRLTNFTVDNVVLPPLDEAKPSFRFPAVSPPWDGGVAVEWDRDTDDEGDPDDTTDTDDDNDSDEDSDEGRNSDTMDFPGGLPELTKHLRVTPPLASKGTKGRVRRR
jgi:hypothetical protein